MQHINVLTAACSSALLYSISLMWLNECWYLVVPALIILLRAVYVLCNTKKIVLILSLWSVLVVFAHYFWVVPSLKIKLEACNLAAGILYAVISLLHAFCFIGVFLIAAAIACFFKKYFSSKLLSCFFFASTFFLSFSIAGSMLMFILDGEGCSNLLSPMIPLSKFFMPSAPSSLNLYQIQQKENSLAVGCLKIINLKICNMKTAHVSSWGRAQQVVYALQALGNKGGELVLITTPESCIACPINREPELLSFIQQAIAPNQRLLLAAQHQEASDRLFQAVYLLTNQDVQLVYLKRHAMPCFERMPRYLEGFAVLRSLFRAEKNFSYAAVNSGGKGFEVDGVRIVSRLCSDFFLVTSTLDLVKLRHSQNECHRGRLLVVILHVNDTWFMPYMCSLLYHVAHMRAWLAGVDLVYVGYASDGGKLK